MFEVFSLCFSLFIDDCEVGIDILSLLLRKLIYEILSGRVSWNLDLVEFKFRF